MMKRGIIGGIGIAAWTVTLATLAGLATSAKAADAARFTLASPAFKDGGALPPEFTCDGERASPPLEWSNPPAGTRSFAVTMHHIPGPGDKHVYLVIYNIPADTHTLAKNSQNVGLFGINTVNGQQEYMPPCSKGPGQKKYTLTVYALSAEPKFSVGADAVTMDLLLDAIKETTLGKTELNVTYDRTGKTPAGQNANGPPDQNGPPPPGPGGSGGSGGPGGPGGAQGDRRPGPPELRAIESVHLTDEQKQRVEPILRDFHEKQDKLREELLKQLKDVLDPEQYEEFESAFKRPPPPPRPQTNRDATEPPAAQPGASASPAAPGVAVIFTGGYETEARDGGRPVVLIAAALKVPADVFRKAFSNVKPARGGQEPDPAQVSKNKQALLSSLGPYGVTNERLDTVSNYYRYSRSKGEMWRHTPAAAYATIHDGVVTAVTITDPGSGYSSPPTLSIPGIANANLTATLWFGDDFVKNGSIKEITIAAPAAPALSR